MLTPYALPTTVLHELVHLSRRTSLALPRWICDGGHAVVGRQVVGKVRHEISERRAQTIVVRVRERRFHESRDLQVGAHVVMPVARAQHLRMLGRFRDLVIEEYFFVLLLTGVNSGVLDVDVAPFL